MPVVIDGASDKRGAEQMNEVRILVHARIHGLYTCPSSPSLVRSLEIWGLHGPVLSCEVGQSPSYRRLRLFVL
jgi:hypothetical protein